MESSRNSKHLDAYEVVVSCLIGVIVVGGYLSHHYLRVESAPIFSNKPVAAYDVNTAELINESAVGAVQKSTLEGGQEISNRPNLPIALRECLELAVGRVTTDKIADGSIQSDENLDSIIRQCFEQTIATENVLSSPVPLRQSWRQHSSLGFLFKIIFGL